MLMSTYDSLVTFSVLLGVLFVLVGVLVVVFRLRATTPTFNSPNILTFELQNQPEEPFPGKEQRRAERFPFVFRVDIEGEGPLHTADASEGGCYIRGSAKVSRLDEISCKISFPGMLEKLPMNGIVRWVRTKDVSSQLGGVAGFGVEWVDDEVTRASKAKLAYLFADAKPPEQEVWAHVISADSRSQVSVPLVEALAETYPDGKPVVESLLTDLAKLEDISNSEGSDDRVRQLLEEGLYKLKVTRSVRMFLTEPDEETGIPDEALKRKVDLLVVGPKPEEGTDPLESLRSKLNSNLGASLYVQTDSNGEVDPRSQQVDLFLQEPSEISSVVFTMRTLLSKTPKAMQQEQGQQQSSPAAEDKGES